MKPVRHNGKQEVLTLILIVQTVVLDQLVCAGGYFLIKGMWSALSGGGVVMDGWLAVWKEHCTYCASWLQGHQTTRPSPDPVLLATTAHAPPTTTPPTDG